MRRSITLAAIGILFLVTAGCENKVSEQNQGLYQQNRELQAQLNDARAHPTAASSDSATVAALRQQLQEKDAQISQLRADSARPASGAQPGMAGVETTYDPQAGTLTATVPGDVLFDAGMATLKESSTATLSKIVAAIQSQYPDKMVFVDGHTDTDPINRTKGQWSDNRDLSYARAKAVASFMTTSGIDARRITIRAFGDNQPKATKPSSRRVEIVVALR